MRNLLLCLLLLGTAQIAFTQPRFFSAKKDSTKFNNRKYKYELGVDMQGIFGGNPGTGLIWKIRDDHSKLVPVSYSKYWRFQVFTSSNTTTNHSLNFQSSNVLYNYDQPTNANAYIGLSVGRERNNFYDRFNFFYGFDAGVIGSYYQTTYNVYSYHYDNAGTLLSSGFAPFSQTDRGLGVSGYVFIGVKYHFSERISISFESAFFASYMVHRLKATANFFDEDVTSNTSYSTFGHALDYLRSLSINYHFKEY